MAYIFPKKIFPSSLNKYLLCPFRFKCHNDKEVKAKFVDTPENFIGNVAHMVLKNFFDISEIPIDKREKQDIGQMVRYSWARVPQNNFTKNYWTAEQRNKLFKSVDQEKAFGLKTITMLTNYIVSADLSVIPLSLEDWMEYHMGNFLIAGRIDRIDQDSKSSISVWDYKTGKLPFFSTIDKIIENDVQIPIYAIIASKLNPFAEKIRAGLIYIKYSKVYEIEWRKEELKDLETKITSILEKAKNDKQLLPRINKLCDWCEYKNICPAQKGKKTNKSIEKKVDEVSW